MSVVCMNMTVIGRKHNMNDLYCFINVFCLIDFPKILQKLQKNKSHSYGYFKHSQSLKFSWPLSFKKITQN